MGSIWMKERVIVENRRNREVALAEFLRNFSVDQNMMLVGIDRNVLKRSFPDGLVRDTRLPNSIKRLIKAGMIEEVSPDVYKLKGY